MKAQVKTIEGGVVKDIELPAMFSEEYRPDLIKKAVMALQSVRSQPHGSYPYRRYLLISSRLGKRPWRIACTPSQERFPCSEGPAGKRRP